MDNPRPEKVAVVTEVRERFDRAGAAILTEYRGLTVKEIAELRRSLRTAGGDYRIYKNTLVRFAANDLGLRDLGALLTGPTAIAFVDPAVDGRGGDAAEVAKALRDYARANPKLVVKGGVLGGTVMSAADTNALADLPSRDVMLARLAGALAAPMRQFAGLLQALPRNFAYGLQALIDQGGAAPSPASNGSSATAEPATGTAGPPAGTAEPSTGTAEPTAEPTTGTPEPTGTTGSPAPSDATPPAGTGERPDTPAAPLEPTAAADAPPPADAAPPVGTGEGPDTPAAEPEPTAAADADPVAGA
jgi:large subunit ribosomal protein L10